MRRFTRPTDAFSKKLENHGRMVSLHFFHCNFCRSHQTTRTTLRRRRRLRSGRGAQVTWSQ